ncbi:MAG: nicotinamide mononucleotide transporter, partial [Hydrogeniiclostridium sp.]
TSCLAVLLTYKRSPFFAAAYAANDLVLIVLWGLAALEDLSYLSVFVCFAAFFVNDLYGFRSWTRMEKRQFANTSACARMVAAEQEDR